MHTFMNERWDGLKPEARSALSERDYSAGTLATRIAGAGVEAGEITGERDPQVAAVWIPGVELFPRKIFPQRHRGSFGELVRQDEGPLAAIQLWPRQWAAARMFASSAKGFHIHPPHVPEGTDPATWFHRLYLEDPSNHALRPYGREQWDVMFFLQGRVEILLIDERAGLERRRMRVFIEGDDHRGKNNAGIVIPPGVAHAIRVEGTSDAIMVYGTSTKFDPSFEGRIADGIERAVLPAEWEKYFGAA
jgi:dTDP-4-dehydrorhamnose 3,5-epimerase-like enzyme